MNITQERASDFEMQKNRLYEQQLELCCRHARQKEEYRLGVGNMQHDMRKHLVSLYELLRKNEVLRAEAYIRCLIRDESLRRLEEISHSGNIIVDSLLNDTYARARKQNIDFLANVELPATLPVCAGDLTVVLKNLMENALNGCQNAEVPERRIDVAAECERDILAFMVCYSCKNGKEEPKRKTEAAQNVRVDSEADLTAVEQTVKKYRGKISVEQGENSCCVTVVMFGNTESAE